MNLQEYFERVAERGVRGTAEDARAEGRGGASLPRARGIRAAARDRDPAHRAHAFRGLLPHRLGPHPGRPGRRHPRRAGPRLGRREPARLQPGHHRRRPDRVRPPLRALPEPRAHQPPGHRHRFLRPAPGGGHRLRHGEVRPGQRQPDHHLRDDGGQGGHPGRRPGPRRAPARGGPHRQDDPARPGCDDREVDRADRPAQGAPGQEPEDRPSPRDRPEGRGPGPPPVHPRRRPRHHAPADRGVPPPLQVDEGRDHDPVRDGRRRGHRPAEDGHPRAAQPDRHRRRPGPDQEGPRRDDRHEDPAHRRPEDVRPLPGGGDGRRLPVREPRDEGAPPQLQAGRVPRPHRPQRPLPARPAQERHDRRVRQAQAPSRGGQVRHPGDRARPPRDARHHRLPGTGHADRGRAGRLLPGRGRRAAQGHGQEGRRDDAPAEGRFSQGRAEKGTRLLGQGQEPCSRTSRTSPNTGSTSPTAPSTPSSPTRRPISRPITPSTTWPPC